MAKFKVGDKVRIRKDLNTVILSNGIYVDRSILTMSGQEVTIKFVYPNYYSIYEDRYPFNWTDEMFEPIVEKTYPRVMLVSNDNKSWSPRVVIAHKRNRYVVWAGAETLEDAEKQVETYACRYAKELQEEEKVVEMTMEQVCEALGKTVKIIK